MKRLSPPDFFNDHVALVTLSQNSLLNSHPHVLPHVNKLRAAYRHYVVTKGDATKFDELDLPDPVRNYLRGHYKSPPKDLAHIAEIREKSAIKVCSMCGSLHCGTLDHVLPRANFPEFAVFGPNLVPACHPCNAKRGTNVVGPGAGERVLHPYFDDCLADRLVSARFTDLGLIPDTSLRVLMDPADPRAAAVRFHVETIIETSGAVDKAAESWVKLMRRPGQISTDLEENPLSPNHLRMILQRELKRLDDFHESKNNWLSMFVAGLLDDGVVDWLFGRFIQPNRLPDGPLATA